jgi:uncharacterized membrane protein
LATYLSYPAPYNRKAAQPSISLRLAATPKSLRRTEMLWTITIILFILWILGLISSYTLGGWIHILLVLAVIVLIFNLLSGRRAL